MGIAEGMRLIRLRMHEVVRLGFELRALLDVTWSC
jgi:7-cyano-7-deazaguanine synthase in queuosine biosynthesis